MAASRSSGVLSASVRTPLSSRLANPTSVPAGGSSINAVTPSSRRVAWQASQRTGRVTWATSRRSASAPSLTAAPSALDSSVVVGVRGRRTAACSPSACSAGAMNRVWNAPATASGITRARAGGFVGEPRPARRDGPAATIWPAPLRLAGSSPSSSRRASTSSGFPPRTALMPVGSSAHAAAISRPRTAASATAASGVEHAGDRGRGQLADGVPGGDQRAPAARREPAAGRGRAARWRPRGAGSPRCP